MNEVNIQCTFHYVPLHESPMYKNKINHNREIYLPNTENYRADIRLPILGV